MRRLFRGNVAAGLGSALCGLLIASASALASDERRKAYASAATPSANGLYLSMDGSYQSIGLPTIALGWRTTIFPALGYGDYTNRFNPRPTGYGTSGEIGYVFRDGVWPSWLGRNVRLEIGGSYVQAEDRQSGIGRNALEFATQAVNGVTSGGFLCAASCYTNAQLQTDYDSWRINGKVAGDHLLQGMTLTPSMTLFVGHTDVDQRLSQSLINNALGPLVDRTYTATSALRWTEWGAKVGLDVSVPLGSGGLALGVGGNVGLAQRNVSLFAASQSSIPFLPDSAVSAQADKGAVLANVEASLGYRPIPSVSFRTFAGVSFDSAVPGVQGPLPPPTWDPGGTGTPAGIKYGSESSYYAGGGLTVKFGL